MMSNEPKKQPLRAELHSVKRYAKIYQYPCGITDIVASSNPDFGPGGWECSEDWSKPGKQLPKGERKSRLVEDPQGEDQARSMRRARAKLRRLALSNEFKWFVTLTLDPAKVDRYDGAAVVRKLNAWCSNAVQRHGLRYLLVPELHRDGGIHFHGFFSDAFPAVDSGTLRVPWSKKPRRPRSAAEREDWGKRGGKVVYNLPVWTLGFTTAMELYGEYPAAVAYVCKYIGKDGTKPAGRWYYSGGDLREPEVAYADISPADLRESYGDRVITLAVPGKEVAVINGIKEEST